MVRHFKTKKEAHEFKDQQNLKNHTQSLKVFRKSKGMKNRIQKPFVVCTHLEWLNLD